MRTTKHRADERGNINRHSDQGAIPRVSVILPVYNAADTLDRAIISIVEQDFHAFELLIADDGSSDSSLEIIQSWATRDQRIRFVTRENRGLGTTLNELIALASCPYIARMDADDISLPHRLQAQVDFLDSNPNVVLVGGQINLMLGDTQYLGRNYPFYHQPILNELFQMRFPLCHPAIMFRAQSARDIGGYRVSGAGEDLDFFFRMGHVGELANVKATVLSYRVTLTSLGMSKSFELSENYRVALVEAAQQYHTTHLRSSKVWVVKIAKIKTAWEIFWMLRQACEYFYRRSLIARSKNKIPQAILFLMLSAVLRPFVAARRLFAKLAR